MGHAELTVNGTVVGQPSNCYNSELVAGTLVTFGTIPLNQGDNQIVLRSVGKSTMRRQAIKSEIDSYQDRTCLPVCSTLYGFRSHSEDRC